VPHCAQTFSFELLLLADGDCEIGAIAGIGRGPRPAEPDGARELLVKLMSTS
jgi:hypothetical protein